MRWAALYFAVSLVANIAFLGWTTWHSKSGRLDVATIWVEIAFTALWLVCAVGLWSGKAWARRLAIVTLALVLLSQVGLVHALMVAVLCALLLDAPAPDVPVPPATAASSN